MNSLMSLHARRELTAAIRRRYASAGRAQKSKILDEFTAATGYGRKHAIAVLSPPIVPDHPVARRRSRTRYYNEDVYAALVTVWEASNRLCSKRLVPYLATFIEVLERFGHLKLSQETRDRLLRMSAATVDRLLYQNRHGKPRSLSTTRPGALLKHQIPIRTFTDWDDEGVGFLEADSVAHCGSSLAGTFLNTLVLTDVATGWTECRALLYKDQDFVVQSIDEARDRFPFIIKGLDSDNGSEFITSKLLAYCEKHRITFTRSRPYKKNDQCFVEQKNGNIVRRLVGYDRYEGMEAARVLDRLYDVVRLYTNFFQPSMQLVSKTRQGAKTKRIYDVPRTPYDRVLESDEVSASRKTRLRSQYRSLDPVVLLAELRLLQQELWTFGYGDLPSRRAQRPAEVIEYSETPSEVVVVEGPVEIFHKTRKPHKKHKKHKRCVHWWKTYPDAFESVWSECEAYLNEQSNLAATEILRRLQVRHPETFKPKQLRTLQRRVRAWRLNQVNSVVVSYRPRGDSLPEEHEIEIVVTRDKTNAGEPFRYDST